MEGYNIALVGATGMVGRTFLKVLAERKFPIANLYAFASERSAGQTVRCGDREVVVEALDENSFDRDIDIALFSAGAGISKKFAPIAKSKGVIVVDNSSAWRMDKEIPLVVPEVNPDDAFSHDGIIANPNCSTIQCMLPLRALQQRYGLERVIYNTYQSVSGSGVKGVKDLEEGTTDCYPYPIQNNCLPHIDVFLENGYTKEEQKMIDETRKILGVEDLPITATAVRIPVASAHSVSINVTLKEDFELDEVKQILSDFPNLILKDNPEKLEYPMPIDAAGHDEVWVGRIRRDDSFERTLNLWVVADNIRKGAASNTVQIAELLITREPLKRDM
ncbi:MAG: aspartate-semialdehyde dehydrogenase [Tissierellales bacterium]|jgi:aspartate-semialdehyde dehydrogenase|nr:aspartate-semialdehyde dehydrogenase [Tissierellales bacterium]